MPTWLIFILKIVLYAAVLLVVYNVLKNYVLTKFNPNKWLIMVIGLVVFLVPTIISTSMGYKLDGTIWQLIQSGVFIILFLWFLDLAGYGASRKYEKKDAIKIKPKAKPNRVKNRDKK